MNISKKEIEKISIRLFKCRIIHKRGCWLVPTEPHGNKRSYANIRITTLKTIGAHRLAAHLFLNLPLNSDTLVVCHKCDMPRCFNPKHLFVGTHTDNMRDKIRKGRAGHTGRHRKQN